MWRERNRRSADCRRDCSAIAVVRFPYPVAKFGESLSGSFRALGGNPKRLRLHVMPSVTPVRCRRAGKVACVCVRAMGHQGRVDAAGDGGSHRARGCAAHHKLSDVVGGLPWVSLGLGRRGGGRGVGLSCRGGKKHGQLAVNLFAPIQVGQSPCRHFGELL